MTEQIPPDAEIVARVLAGEIQMFGTLVERYERLMFSFLLPQVRSFQEVEDITQDAFIKAFRHLGSFDPSRRFSAWLVKIGRNLVIDHYRKNSNVVPQTEMVQEFLSKRAGDPAGTNPAHRAEVKEEFHQIFLDLLHLPEEHKVPLLMRVVQGLSYEEIADVMELPLQTVKNRIFKARKALREKRVKEHAL